MRKIQFGETIQKRRSASRPGGKAAAAFLCQLALSGLPLNATAEPSVYPTGVTRYDPAKAFNSYVLFSGADKITRLIDLNGTADQHHDWWRLANGNTLILANLLHPAPGFSQPQVLEAAQSFGNGSHPNTSMNSDLRRMS